MSRGFKRKQTEAEILALLHLKTKEPRRYTKPDELCRTAELRFKKRYAHYKDCIVMYNCAGRSDFFKAYYGIPAIDVEL